MENNNIKKYFDLSAYNQTTDWKRIELPFRRIAEEPEVYILMAILITMFCVPLNIFLIVQILRYAFQNSLSGNSEVVNKLLLPPVIRFSHRRTAINGLITVSSLVSLTSLAHCIQILINNDFLCASTFLIFPTLMLLEKLLLTAMAVVRHNYVLYSGLIYQNNASFIFISALLTSLIIALIPCMTLAHESHPLWRTCLLIHEENSTDDYAFLLAFFIIIANSLMVDVICYSRILNYMRKNSVRVSIVASTPMERNKSHNIVTATSSFLIWLVNVASMIPASILMIRSGPALDANHIVTLINFQEYLVVTFAIINPLLFIGSSSDLRRDVELCKKHLVRNFGTGAAGAPNDVNMPPNGRSEIYALS